MTNTPPKNQEHLIDRTLQIAGKSLNELAKAAQMSLPENLLHGKGLIGQLLEYHLGTTAGNKSMPDFHHLGIELKTIPIDKQGKPKETTYVCTVPLMGHAGLQWRTSKVYEKLAKVLWMPIEADPNIPILDRRVGMGILWELSHEQEAILQQDWNEHMEKIALGEIESISAHQGEYLQIRPKAQDSHSQTKAIGPDGHIIKVNPRGFYLRTQFSREILQKSYL